LDVIARESEDIQEEEDESEEDNSNEEEEESSDDEQSGESEDEDSDKNSCYKSTICVQIAQFIHLCSFFYKYCSKKRRCGFNITVSNGPQRAIACPSSSP